MTYAVIMAGGVGSRFWPMSRKSKPKQFLKFFNDRSLIQNTVDRIKKLIPVECIMVVTNEQYVSMVQEQVPEIPAENIIGEPMAKNTAPCIALAATIIHQNDPDGVMVVLPSDHHITEPDAFIDVIKSAVGKAERNESLVTIGIKPHRPETGYGYIQFEESDSVIINDNPVHRVKTFAEKPDMETAIQFVNSGDFLWNSGMFIWKAETILHEMQQHLHEIYDQTDKLSNAVAANKDIKKAIYNFYDSCLSISIDYGIMEKAATVYVVPGDFGWNDVGSWMAVYELEDKDDNGNVSKITHSRFVNSNNCYVSSESNKLISLVGLQGVTVVETEDAILVCRLDAAQDVKKLVDSLDEDDYKQFQ
ncbi:MAG TPA: mannose-1-phosphate guanylyltransferase [Balneolales bacterium]|nr:mannose-1-phosphate guanylyltransferase [Balneolales bacterium]